MNIRKPFPGHRIGSLGGMLIGLALLHGANLFAQESLHIDDDDAPTVEATAFQQESAEPMGTLPAVEVQPSDLPSSVVTGGEIGEVPQSGGLFDLPFSYPSLSDQLFEGASSGVRGLNRSVADLPNNATIIDRATIQEKQAQTLMQALQNETGVLVQQTGRGQSSIFMRGVTGQQVLILVDGIRVNNSTLCWP